MNSGKKFLQFGYAGVRQFTTQQTRLQSQKEIVNYNKLKGKQEKFQVNNGQLVHEKGGVLDRIFYQATVALCIVGLGFSGKVLYDLSFPKKS